MNKLEQVFKEQKKVFIGFITAGDPSLDVTKELIVTMAKAGAGIIELGIPFSDPVAEGEVIQRANIRALKGHVTTDAIFAMIKEVRKETDVPLVFLNYANQIYTYGCEKFFANCAEVGVYGVIVPDIPYEEREEFMPYSTKHNVAMIPLIAPTSHERIHMIAKEAHGYVYLVSSLGVTGVRDSITTDMSAIVSEVRKVTDVPCAVGFGISEPEQAYAMAKVSDGAIVGSAIEKIVEQYGENCAPHVYDYVKKMSDAVKRAV